MDTQFYFWDNFG